MSTANRNEIVSFCEKYLKVSAFKDYCHNGLQVEGAERVRRLVCGVSLSVKLIEQAMRRKADILLVHHGIFNDSLDQPPKIQGFMKLRLRLLLEHDINLLGFHLPLDAHPVIGNNISLCRLLGVKNAKALDVGFIGRLERKLDLSDFTALVNKKLQTNSYVIRGGPATVHTLAVISGGSSTYFSNAKAAGADTFLCGDMRESVVRPSEELRMNVINAGHYNTEKCGVKNLAELLARRFKISSEFVEVPCDV